MGSDCVKIKKRLLNNYSSGLPCVFYTELIKTHLMAPQVSPYAESHKHNQTSCKWYSVILIFYKQEVSFGVLAEDLYGFFRHLHNRGVSCAVPENLKFHVFWLKQTWWRKHKKENKKKFGSVKCKTKSQSDVIKINNNMAGMYAKSTSLCSN